MLEKEYWNTFYSGSTSKFISQPSQFAAFVAGEITGSPLIIDTGCGNGRDSFFFSSLGFKSLGIDSSNQAINYCKHMAEMKGYDTKFIEADLGLPDTLIRIIKNEIEQQSPHSLLIYSRFFLHAITEDCEEQLLCSIKEVSNRILTHAYFEFRTEKDSYMPKETDSHYRRYLNPTKAINRAVNHGLNLVYYVEGFGLAKYHSDDAHVARIVLSS